MTKAEIEKEKEAILFYMSCGYDVLNQEYLTHPTHMLAEHFFGPFHTYADPGFATMRRRLAALKKEGKIKKNSNGWWKLTRPFVLSEWTKEHA